MPNDRETLADRYDRMLRDWEEAQSQRIVLPSNAESPFVDTARRLRRTTPGGRNLNYIAEQRILVDPTAPITHPTDGLTYYGGRVSVDTVRESLGLPGIAEGEVIEVAGESPGRSLADVLRDDPTRRPIFTRPQEPWVIDRPTSLQDMYMRHNVPVFVASTRGLTGHSGETISAPCPVAKPDYEIVTDTVLIGLILEHVRPWFDSRAKVDIRINKLEKVNIKASPNRYRVYAGYQYKEATAIRTKIWRKAVLWVTNTGEVQS